MNIHNLPWPELTLLWLAWVIVVGLGLPWALRVISRPRADTPRILLSPVPAGPLRRRPWWFWWIVFGPIAFQVILRFWLGA